MQANYAIITTNRGVYGFWTKSEALSAWENISHSPLFSGSLLQGNFWVSENFVGAKGRVFTLAREYEESEEEHQEEWLEALVGYEPFNYGLEPMKGTPKEIVEFTEEFREGAYPLIVVSTNEESRLIREAGYRGAIEVYGYRVDCHREEMRKVQEVRALYESMR